MKEITSSSEFKSEVLETEQKVIVDFYSVGCGPCRSMEPVFKAAEERNPEIKFVKVESGDASDVFSDYRVNRVPTFVVFVRGKDVDRRVGVMSGDDLDTWLKKRYDEDEVKNDK